MILRSVSEPSLGTSIGHASTIRTAATSRGSVLHTKSLNRLENYRGRRLWEGRVGRVTLTIMLLPWNIWWQTIVMLAIIYKYVTQLLLAYIFKSDWNLIKISLIVGETLFMFDWLIYMLHAHWLAVRLHIRVYRRNYLFLIYDGISILPLPFYWIGSYYNGNHIAMIIFIGRWLGIFRIYRLIYFFKEVNETERRYRRCILILENLVTLLLPTHMGACLWYSTQAKLQLAKPWHSLGYPARVSAEKLEFNSYLKCFYYCATRCFNTIFGDSFPMVTIEKVLTAIIMLVGFCLVKYWFIGSYAWELVLENRRWMQFLDSYHHMLTYLKICGAPSWLEEQAMNFKKQLWYMKNGVLTSTFLKELPHSLQTELIFDINVSYFHNSILFRDTGEAFMRQISLLMRHELYLEGQQIWSQGVVKNGMFCVKKGVIEVLSDEDDESPMIAFKEGTVMGELSLFYSIPSKVTVKAATYVELQVLPRTNFVRAMSESPQVLIKIRNKIEKRLGDALKRQSAIDKYDKSDSRLIRTRYRPLKLLKDRLSGVEDEDPTFVDTSHLYYRDENNDRQPKFIEEYLELYELSPNVTTVETPSICINSNFPWILEPNTPFIHMFDVAHFIIVLYVCIATPVYAVMLEESDFERVCDYIITSCLLLNIYLQLTTCISDKGIRKETVREIAEVKMSTVGFYLDIISVFPISIFANSLDPNGDSILLELSKLCQILQVWHLWDYMQKWEKAFSSNVKLICLCKFGILLLIFCYWSGGILYLYACPKRLCKENSWMSLLIFFETKLFVTSDAKHENQFLSSIAFGTAVFTGSGTADFVPGRSELILVVFLILIGAYLNSIYFAKVCSIFLLSMQRKLKFKESMRELSYFLTVNRVSGKIKARVRKIFTVQWYYNKSVSTKEIFKDMSVNVQQEILFTEMVEILLYCPLFQDCSRDFLQTVAGKTITVVLPDNEVVQHAADIGRDMYIVQKGHCNILSHNGKFMKSIGPGSYFGVVEMILGLPKVYTVLTSTNCILRHLEYSALVQCWSTFPGVSQPIVAALRDPEILELASCFEDSKPLTARIDNKMNRIAQEIKESFVMLRSHEERREYVKAFEKLGFFRYRRQPKYSNLYHVKQDVQRQPLLPPYETIAHEHVRYVFLPGCITPYGLFLKFWCALRVAFACYYIIIIPYNVAVKFHSRMTYSHDWLDLFLYIDIIVMAYVAYYNEKSLLVTHPLLSVTKYLRSTFWWDLLAIFPFELLFRIVNNHMDKDLCRINRLLLVTRISGAFSYWESDIMRVNLVVVMLRYIPFAITFINFMTAIIFMKGCSPVSNSTSVWIMVKCSTHNVSIGKNVEQFFAVNEYLNYLFWVLEVFLGCGCTPSTLSSFSEMWLVMVLQVTGFLYFAFMFGYISSTRSASSQALLEHSENTRDLENFLYQENVDPGLTAKTIRYFEYVWKRTNGGNPQKICRRLNSALMEDTLVFMYEHALREVPLFGKVERSFIRIITQHLHEMYFLKGETVVQCRDLQSDVYIIYKGKVDVLNSYNEMVSCMGPGGMFGNFTGQPTSCSEVSVFASRSLDLLVLPSQTFFNLIKYYPKIQEPLNKAFALSKDYILPITMDITEYSSEDESAEDDMSEASGFDSRSGSRRFDNFGGLSYRSSHSELSQAKSYVSVSTFHSYMHIANVLRPGSWLFQVFGYFSCVMTTFNYVLVLYEVVTLNNCQALFYIQAVCDIFFYFKIYLSMHQGFLRKRGDFVMESAKCRRRYFNHKKRMWIDILVNFPFEFFGFCFSNPLKAIHYLRIHKLFRLIYIVEFYRKTAAGLTNNLTTLQAVTTIFLVVLLVHTASCLWLLTMIATAPISIIRTMKMHLIDEESPQHEWDYVTSFYVVVAELTITGGDEFQVDHLLPTVILALSLISGKMLAATIVATSIQVAYATKHALTNYERKTGELIDVLKNQGLSVYQTKKFWKYVQQLWVNERGRQLPVLLNQTPYVRRCDLMSAMFGHHLRNCYLFADIEEAFLRQVTAAMEYTIFFPGNYIVSAGDSEARMYWVASGTVAVVSVRNDLTETTHELLSTGDVFGILQGITRGIAHVFSYRAETNVSLLSLSMDSWVRIIQFFPEAQKVLNERSEYLFTQIAP